MFPYKETENSKFIEKIRTTIKQLTYDVYKFFEEKYPNLANKLQIYLNDVILNQFNGFFFKTEQKIFQLNMQTKELRQTVHSLEKQKGHLGQSYYNQ